VFFPSFLLKRTMSSVAIEIDPKGSFQRVDRTFRNWIKADGSTPFLPEKNRYHLYISYACPWAHRTLIVRSIKGLEDVISYDVVDHFLDRSKSWSLEGKVPGSTGDTVNGAHFLKEVYLKADPKYDQSFTVPVLWDKKNQTIVNNESSEIIRMLNSEFNQFAKNKELDLYPENLRSQIDEVNSWVYDTVNTGVYKCGFAQSQEAYDLNVRKLFDSLNRLETILSKNKFLIGDQFTEADVRLFTSLLRFDSVYYVHFKCSLKHIYEYPNLWEYVRGIYQNNGIAQTVNWEHIIKHYFVSHAHINPFRIVPIGPVPEKEAHQIFSKPSSRLLKLTSPATS